MSNNNNLSIGVVSTRVSLEQLKTHFPHAGRIEWLGVRPALGAEMIELDQVQLVTGRGIEGDRAGVRPHGKRQVTLIQAEYLPMLSNWTGLPKLHWKDFRRNIVISGINLNALINTRIHLGSALLDISGFCHPCRKLEQQLGYGLFNMLRGHGGLTARVVQDGSAQIGDAVHFVETASSKA